MAQKHPPTTREKLLAACPDSQSSPIEVRDWLKKYLEYRGLDPGSSTKFVWRGIELHRARHANLIDAFQQHCGVLSLRQNFSHKIFSQLSKARYPHQSVRPSRCMWKVYSDLNVTTT